MLQANTVRSAFNTDCIKPITMEITHQWNGNNTLLTHNTEDDVHTISAC